ncbi:MAG: hypothetical protein FWG69_02765 [Oscillospiraceae bacterium]|nr:hypothetical protein [Oscillospiraceae bacterium]
MNNNDTKVKCFQCKYFSIVWEKQNSKVCKRFGFKSSVLPSIAVYQSTGTVCLGFEPKEQNAKKANGGRTDAQYRPGRKNNKNTTA